MLQDLLVFLIHPGYPSLLRAPEVQSQVVLVDPCLPEYLGNLDHRGALVLLSLAKSPVEHVLVMKWIMDQSP